MVTEGQSILGMFATSTAMIHLEAARTYAEHCETWIWTKQDAYLLHVLHVCLTVLTTMFLSIGRAKLNATDPSA